MFTRTGKVLKTRVTPKAAGDQSITGRGGRKTELFAGSCRTIPDGCYISDREFRKIIIS
jgi:hypothetical protein